MAGPSWAASGTAVSAAGGTSANFGAPAGVVNNSIVIVDFFLDGETERNVVPPDSSWFLVEGAPMVVALSHRHYVYWHRASGAESGPYAFSWTGAAFIEGQAHRYEAAATSGNPWDAGAAAATETTNSTDSPSVSITTAGADRLLIHAATNWAGGTWTPAAGYTKRQQAAVGLSTLADRPLAGQGSSGAVVATCTGSQRRSAWLGALKPVAAGATFAVTGSASVADLTASLTLTFANQSNPVVSTIEWGDGTTSTVSGVGPHTHLYAVAGTYAILVTSTDATAAVDTTALPVTVYAPATGMTIQGVMDAVCARLATIAGLRCHAHPAGSVTPPAAIVSYPEQVEFDETYLRGMDRMTLPVVVVVGKVSDRAARDKLSTYCAGFGSASVKAVIESGTYSVFHTVRVAEIEFDTVTIGAVDYIAALFTLDIAGSGKS